MRLKNLIYLFIPVLVLCQEAKDTEIWGPVPEEVYTISDSAPPTDAIILFDGSDLSKWKPRWGKDKSEWLINKDGSVTDVFDDTGGNETKENFDSDHLLIKKDLIVEFFCKVDTKFKF